MLYSLTLTVVVIINVCRPSLIVVRTKVVRVVNVVIAQCMLSPNQLLGTARILKKVSPEQEFNGPTVAQNWTYIGFGIFREVYS